MLAGSRTIHHPTEEDLAPTKIPIMTPMLHSCKLNSNNFSR